MHVCPHLHKIDKQLHCIANHKVELQEYSCTHNLHLYVLLEFACPLLDADNPDWLSVFIPVHASLLTSTLETSLEQSLPEDNQPRKLITNAC